VGDNLDIVEIDLRNGEESSEFALYQNEPNPFTDYTTIGFRLPEAGQATITLYDVTGKILNVMQGNYDKGYNTVKLTKEDLSVSGMIYYKLQSGQHSAVKHLIVVQ
jgi:hypothetical protein